MSADWDIAQTIHGPRRVVASPLPIRILELDVIQHLVKLQAVVICGGGGGVPVAQRGQHLTGMPAVIDKDHFSSRLALDLQADALIISTDADAVYSDFATPEAKAHRMLTVADIQSMDEQGQFPTGSMRPKLHALCSFASASGGGKAVLCSPGNVLESLRGEGGTTIVG
jgi:carbamate kinase